MESLKFAPNCRREGEFGRPYGCCRSVRSMEHGLPLGRSTYWRLAAKSQIKCLAHFTLGRAGRKTIKSAEITFCRKRARSPTSTSTDLNGSRARCDGTSMASASRRNHSGGAVANRMEAKERDRAKKPT